MSYSNTFLSSSSQRKNGLHGVFTTSLLGGTLHIFLMNVAFLLLSSAEYLYPFTESFISQSHIIFPRGFWSPLFPVSFLWLWPWRSLDTCTCCGGNITDGSWCILRKGSPLIYFKSSIHRSLFPRSSACLKILPKITIYHPSLNTFRMKESTKHMEHWGNGHKPELFKQIKYILHLCHNRFI